MNNQFDVDPLENVTRILNAALEGAKTYNGSEVAEERLIETLSAFEQSAQELVRQGAADAATLTATEAEERLSQALYPNKAPVSVSSLLDLAVHSFGLRLEAGNSALTVVETGYCFLPTDGDHGLLAPSEDSQPYAEAKIEPRTQQLITAADYRPATKGHLQR